MGSVIPLFIMLLLLISPALSFSSSETEKFMALGDKPDPSNPKNTSLTARLLDLVIRDYAVKLYDENNTTTTSVLTNVHLPSNFSGIEVDTARFRCGSLRRYGAKIKEFHLSKYVIINPCLDRVIFIRQELRLKWSNIFYNNSHNMQNYELVTPILGLLAYNGGDDRLNVGKLNPFELWINADKDPIKVDFTNMTRLNSEISLQGRMLHCASFEGQGNMTLTSMVAPNVCHVMKEGHVGLVIESSQSQTPTRANGRSEEYGKKISRWKVALGSSIGAALGAFLLGLLFVAMFVKAKERLKLEDMVRRAYQEEALQVSMVGHVRPQTSHGSD
ncbi:hypothetical protein RND81_08G120600 [Saponaria officinalis]|uniref:Uncharacterized protein n=1 Tax=Saponaria officinalis TaxID=3572 RepID=A0AAW1J6G0_SAPOF